MVLAAGADPDNEGGPDSGANRTLQAYHDLRA